MKMRYTKIIFSRLFYGMSVRRSTAQNLIRSKMERVKMCHIKISNHLELLFVQNGLKCSQNIVLLLNYCKLFVCDKLLFCIHKHRKNKVMKQVNYQCVCDFSSVLFLASLYFLPIFPIMQLFVEFEVAFECHRKLFSCSGPPLFPPEIS